MACIRRQLGKVSSCRVFESFENGYPHIHCILLFEREFSIFRDRKGNFRIREKMSDPTALRAEWFILIMYKNNFIFI